MIKTTFVKTTIPTDQYKAMEEVGDLVICHYGAIQSTTDDGTSITTCYEASCPKADYVETEMDEAYAAFVERRERQQLEWAKQAKIHEIAAYDDSPAVNAFAFNGTTLWFTPDMRKTIRTGVESCKALGRATYDATYNGMEISIPVDTVLALLAQIECYALDCQNTTARHKAAVAALTAKEEVEAYDYTTGYPAQLTLTI